LTVPWTLTQYQPGFRKALQECESEGVALLHSQRFWPNDQTSMRPIWPPLVETAVITIWRPEAI
jgi:hypothetical protein